MVTNSRTAMGSITPASHWAGGAVFCPGQANLLGRCGSDDDRCGRRAGSPGSRGRGWPGTEPGQAADPGVVPGPGRQDVPAQAGPPRLSPRRGAGGGGVGGGGGGAGAGGGGGGGGGGVPRGINRGGGGLSPPMWTVQLSGVIGALPLVAAAAALLRRLRLAAALAAATLLKPL